MNVLFGRHVISEVFFGSEEIQFEEFQRTSNQNKHRRRALFLIWYRFNSEVWRL